MGNPEQCNPEQWVVVASEAKPSSPSTSFFPKTTMRANDGFEG
jgi:hypothetical protein